MKTAEEHFIKSDVAQWYAKEKGIEVVEFDDFDILICKVAGKYHQQKMGGKMPVIKELLRVAYYKGVKDEADEKWPQIDFSDWYDSKEKIIKSQLTQEEEQ